VSAPDELARALAARYRIERKLGEGGMATVYLAEDLKHHRRVALKVLRPELAAVIGAERFLREITTTANLRHPHILPLYDSGEALGSLFYVMPFVEGESLRNRLDREKQLPIDDALQIAREVADALSYAHTRGVIHRDIKPENILLDSGHALVADFGIALAVETAGGERMTQTGVSIGTPPYMSPEQAAAERAIDARSDIYALGAVTYEMLLGEPPFTGPTAQAIVARVMTEQPRPLTLQRHTVPAHVEAAVLCALERLPADRFASAAQFAEALAGREPVVRATAAAAPTPWWRRFESAASVALVALAVAAWGWLRARRDEQRAAEWQYVSLGDSVRVALNSPAMALSPDGADLVFRDFAQNGVLWIKRRGQLDPTAIPGTEGAFDPVFSPDGRWIVFEADGHLKKVRPGGGAAVEITDGVSSGFGGPAWLDDGTLVYVTPPGIDLRRVAATGGPSAVVLHDSTLGGRAFRNPTPLPGARGVLVTICSGNCATMSIAAVDLRTGTLTTLLDDAAQAWYLPGGRLLYVRRDGAALVAPFDLTHLALGSGAVPVLDGVETVNGWTQLAWSPSGTLVYLAASGGSINVEAVRVSRGGAVTPIDTAWYGELSAAALSPDGRRVAVSARTPEAGVSIWVKQLDHGPLTRLSFGSGDRRPAWSPDGRTIAFIRDTANTSVVLERSSDGSGSDRTPVRVRRQVQEVAWSPDGKWLLLRTDVAAAGYGDIIGVRATGDTTPVPLVASSYSEMHPSVSPNGRWLAYTSNESGQNEVYVRPFPGTAGGRWQVSTGGGSSPVWAPDGSELFYLDGATRLVAAEVSRGTAFAVVGRHSLFDASGFALDLYHQAFDVTADGRFLFLRSRGAAVGARGQRIVWVDHWFTDLQAKLVGGK
jgi:Tol biopolymer transport system component/tRNA A-37 threonylcarbamoyl transferase component Bud32